MAANVCGRVKGWWHTTLRKQMMVMENFDVENLKLSKCSMNGYNIGSYDFWRNPDLFRVLVRMILLQLPRGAQQVS